ncbi:nucleoside triphosphate pyrophosphohydrolase [uncultured Dubosiella sp.]|uniref:nucleoside triphosphate pyrophosphohydrolase n=1 Tax=uncultured Dubosiella sp. TaxID=1937011 RepID=UPI0025D54D57|nr:nucleoside triphosphate pyrophosphohydrolase [uncultured Dubosiella sp.]
MKITYNKLVRDHISEIIDADGKTACCRIMEEEEYRNALKKKLVEEACEAQGAYNKEELVKELADVLEVVEALQDANGISLEEI